MREQRQAAQSAKVIGYHRYDAHVSIVCYFAAVFSACLPFSCCSRWLRLLCVALRMACSVFRVLFTRRLIASELRVSPGKLTRFTMRVRIHGTLVRQAYSHITWQRPRATPQTSLKIAWHVCHAPLVCSLIQMSRYVRYVLLVWHRKVVSPAQLAAMDFTAPMGLSVLHATLGLMTLRAGTASIEQPAGSTEVQRALREQT
jgi:hypothetical protein|eukprot:COSAG02_NODE_3854_length_6142_cov_8.420817_4_plen_201_part_00